MVAPANSDPAEVEFVDIRFEPVFPALSIWPSRSPCCSDWPSGSKIR
jgi:hypothetical protein